jgi:hypothetical protein
MAKLLRRDPTVADEAKRWQARSLLATDNSLCARPKHDEALKNEEIKRPRRAHLAAVIDCPDQKSWATSSLAEAGAKEAERALEVASPARPGTLRLTGVTPVMLRQWAHLPRSAKNPAPDSQPERSLGGSRPDVSARSSVFQT